MNEQSDLSDAIKLRIEEIKAEILAIANHPKYYEFSAQFYAIDELTKVVKFLDHGGTYGGEQDAT